MKSKHISVSIDPYAYSISVRRVLVEGDRLFKGTVAELPDVATFEESFEAAYALAIDAIESLYESSVEENRPFPSPLSQAESSEYSGRLTLRMPRWLHTQLGHQADAEGISLNQYLISILSAAGSINAVVQEASLKISNVYLAHTAASYKKIMSGMLGESLTQYVNMSVVDEAPFLKVKALSSATFSTSGKNKYLIGNC